MEKMEGGRGFVDVETVSYWKSLELTSVWFEVMEMGGVRGAEWVNEDHVGGKIYMLGDVKNI